MPFVVIIPARYESTRLPGKPLKDIAGKPMIQHVVEQAQQSNASAVYVATDDKRIETACLKFGARVFMTSKLHHSGTDRIEEVSRLLNLNKNELVVNVQGDEPLIPPAIINQVAENLERNQEAGICTLFDSLSDHAAIENPNVVKLITDAKGIALTFSRAVVPYPRDGLSIIPTGSYKRHIGIYAYRVEVLQQFVKWPIAPIEGIEKLEQLRAMYNGVKIHAEKCCKPVPPGVDSEAELQQVRAILEKK